MLIPIKCVFNQTTQACLTFATPALYGLSKFYQDYLKPGGTTAFISISLSIKAKNTESQVE